MILKGLTVIHVPSLLLAFDSSLCLVSKQIIRHFPSNTSSVQPYPEFYFPNIYNISYTLPNIYPQQKCFGGHGRKREYKFDDLVLEAWITQLWKRHPQSESTSCVYGMCPLVPENMASVWKVINWNFSADSLCMLKETFQNKKQSDISSNANVKVIVFGGSMTLGNRIIGTCCAFHYTQSTISSMKCDRGYEHMESPLQNNRWYCFWFGYLSRWFIHTFPHINFEFHNMAIGGYGSKMMSTEVNSLLKFRNITLSKNDIMLLDHSYNDGFDVAGQGLELLIREIYRHCHDFDPTIIIMEQYPNLKAIYSTGYRQLAKYYQLPYFSHREIILNPTTSQKNLFASISSFALHPPWHVHMLIADEFSSWLNQLIQYKCPTTSSNHFNTQTFTPFYINSTIHIIKKSSSKIQNNNSHKYGIHKQPLLDTTRKVEHFRCHHADNSMLINVSPQSSHLPHNLTEFEKSIKGWTAYQDYERKQPGWIINKFAPLGNRTLNLTIPQFNLTNNNNNNNNNNKYDEIGLRIKYLKTYINAGHLYILLCGLKVGEIDVMTHAHVSVPTLYYYKLIELDVQRCQYVHSSHRTLSLEYTGEINLHRNNNRYDYKVKIYSIHLCYIDNDNS